MTIIQIEKPELEALIHDRMQAGKFQTVEEFLLDALQTSSLRGDADRKEGHSGGATGADLVAAMQDSPYKEIDLESASARMAVRDVTL